VTSSLFKFLLSFHFRAIIDFLRLEHFAGLLHPYLTQLYASTQTMSIEEALSEMGYGEVVIESLMQEYPGTKSKNEQVAAFERHPCCIRCLELNSAFWEHEFLD
jgi:hypothetical protein